MLNHGKLVGHPVDVASGVVYTEQRDLRLPGRVELTWDRRYSTSLLTSESSLGPGWTTPFFALLERTPGGFRFTTPEGDVEEFQDPPEGLDTGAVARNLATFQELERAHDTYVLTRWTPGSEEIRRFVFPIRGEGPWPLSAIEDPTGQGLDLGRDDYGRIVTIRQRREGRVLRLTYDQPARITALTFDTHDQGRLVLARYEYDQAGRLATAHDALGHSENYEYDDHGRLLREVRADGTVFTFEYDDEGRCIRTVGADGYDEKIFRFFGDIGFVEVTNSLREVTRYQVTPTGQVMAEIDPLGNTRLTEYDQYARIVSRTDANAGTTRYEYDERGNRTRIVDALGQEYHFAYNESHRLTRFTDPAGSSWTRQYDDRHRITTLSDPEGGSWKFTHDDRGDLVEAVINDRVSLRWRYRGDGTVESLRDAGGNLTRFEFDGMGRLTRKIGPGERSTAYNYDDLGNLLGIRYHDGSRSAYEYDAVGNLVACTERTGLTSHYRYGSCRRLLEAIEPDGATIRLRWTSEPNRLAALQNPKGETVRFEHDAAGRVIAETGFDGQTTTFEYDPNGQLVHKSLPNGDTISFELDPLGRRVAIMPSDEAATRFSYDAGGFLVAAENSECTVQFERDRLGRPKRESRGDYWLDREFDAFGNPVRKETSLGHQLSYQFVAGRLLSELVLDETYRFKIRRNAQGAEIHRDMPGGLTLEQDVDPTGRLARQAVSSARDSSASDTSPVVERRYEWDGPLLSALQDMRWGTTEYSYDDAERLTRATRDRAADESFTYDLAGNLVSYRRDATVAILEYEPGDILVRQGETSYIHDARGRLTRKHDDSVPNSTRAWAYDWNALGHLRRVVDPDQNEWQYGYDPFGRRIRKSGPRGVTEYLWDHDVILHEVKQGVAHATWLFDPHSFKPMGALQESGFYSVVCDHLGTPRELLDHRGHVAWAGAYDATGTLSAEVTDVATCPLRFQGQWHDPETGLHYNRHRYYDPQTLRYTSQDPLWLLGGLNLYEYVKNPINWIDPLGLYFNYVLYNPDLATEDNPNGVYYSGMSSETEADVERRHYDNVGENGQRRYDPDLGDQIAIVNESDSRDVTRGLEQDIASEFDTVIGSQASNGGSVEGNNQNPMNRRNSRWKIRMRAIRNFLRRRGTTTRDLVNGAIEEQEGEC